MTNCGSEEMKKTVREELIELLCKETLKYREESRKQGFISCDIEIKYVDVFLKYIKSILWLTKEIEKK